MHYQCPCRVFPTKNEVVKKVQVSKIFWSFFEKCHFSPEIYGEEKSKTILRSDIIKIHGYLIYKPYTLNMVSEGCFLNEATVGPHWPFKKLKFFRA